MTEFVSKNPQTTPDELHKSVADRIKLVTGIDVMLDKIKLRVDSEEGILTGFVIGVNLTTAKINRLSTEFPELKVK